MISTKAKGVKNAFLTVVLPINSMNPALSPESGHTVGCWSVFIACIPDRTWRRGDIDTGSDGVRIHFQVVASINAGVIVVARDQKSKVTEIRVVVWGKADGRSLGKDFSPIIDQYSFDVGTSQVNSDGVHGGENSHRFAD